MKKCLCQKEKQGKDVCMYQKTKTFMEFLKLCQSLQGFQLPPINLCFLNLYLIPTLSLYLLIAISRCLPYQSILFLSQHTQTTVSPNASHPPFNTEQDPLLPGMSMSLFQFPSCNEWPILINVYLFCICIYFSATL